MRARESPAAPPSGQAGNGCRKTRSRGAGEPAAGPARGRASFADLLAERFRAALACGALAPIATRSEWLADGGVRFLVRVVQGLAAKPVAIAAPAGARDPFAPPYDPALRVAELGPAHVCLLNKFNVLERHALIVTRELAPQDELLDRADLTALAGCLAALDALGFYNGGREAGASQPHKHLQLVPLPLAAPPPSTAAGGALGLAGNAARVPIEAVLGPPGPPGRPLEVAALPFPHRLVWLAPGCWSDPQEHARHSLAAYRAALAELGLADTFAPGERQRAPYNLLVTREWLLAVPRAGEEVAGIPVNALGYAGALLVRDEAGLATVRERGPLAILAAAAGAR